MTITSNLRDFGTREMAIAADLLQSYANSPPDFLTDGVHPVMNINSGYVFLSDDDYNVAMLNDGKLEQFHSCPECGTEGFAEELATENECCQSYVKEATL